MRAVAATGGFFGGVLLVIGLCACREEHGQIEIPRLPPPPDASVPRLVPPDGAASCADDQDCDDGVECTRDLCFKDIYCINVGDNSKCSNDVYCDGVELCSVEHGCMPGLPTRCDDDSVCTLDSCSEEEKSCKHEVHDFDGDGEIDWHCAGGTDCDDFDATRAMAAFEICADGLDNDCDDAIDETRDCNAPRHDTCADAVEVGDGGTYVVDLAGAAADYAPRCGTPGARDAVFTFELEEPQDVSLVVRGILPDGREETAAVAVRRACDDVETEIECSQSFPAWARMRALDQGRYFAIVSSARSAQIALEATFEPPTKAPSNQSCKSPLDVSKGGRFEGDFVDVGDDEELSCGFPLANDLVYRFTLEERRDVELSAISISGERMNLAVRTDCDDADSTLRCVSDAPARGRMYDVAPGTYYIVLESSPAREVDFSLDIAFDEPSQPDPGNGCSRPLPLPLGMETEGSLANHQDLVPVVCQCEADEDGEQHSCNEFRHDVVYEVEVDKAMDIGVSINGSAVMTFDFRQTCDDPASQIECREGALPGTRLRNVAAGTYSLILEAADSAAYTVLLESLPRTRPVAVEGNINCGKAFEVPAKGGLFAGDTLLTRNAYESLCGGNAKGHDAAFHLSLPERARVSAAIEAGFDSVLYRFDDDDGAASCRSMEEDNCDDDGGDVEKNSRLLEVLDAGDYYYIVDGLRETDYGEYLFELVIAPP